MKPAEALTVPLANTVVFGGPKFTRLKRLKNSARNSRLVLSVRAVVLNSEKSKLARPGPLKLPRPTLPNVPAGGSENAAGLNHRCCVPRMIGPEKLELNEGRSGFL